MDEWINVEDRLPDTSVEDFVFVLATCYGMVGEFEYNDNEEWEPVNSCLFPLHRPLGVTHWMPLPEPPK